VILRTASWSALCPSQASTVCHLAAPSFELPSPFVDVGAVLGVPGVVLFDEPEALLRLKAEGLGVVIDRSRVGRGSDKLAHRPAADPHAARLRVTGAIVQGPLGRGWLPG